MRATLFNKGDAVKLTGSHLGALKGAYGVVEEVGDRIDAYGRHFGWVNVRLLPPATIYDRMVHTGMFGVSAVSKA